MRQGTSHLEAFEHVLYPNAVTNKIRSGSTDECKSVKSRKLFSLLYILMSLKQGRDFHAELQ